MRLTDTKNMVKTTFEMDGLLTQKDIDDRHKVMAQCLDCGEYSLWNKEPIIEHDTGETKIRLFRCDSCGSDKSVGNSGVSLRTYNPLTHNKKKKRK